MGRRARASKEEERRRGRRRAGAISLWGGEGGEAFRFACRTVKLLLVAQLVTPFSGRFSTITFFYVWILLLNSLIPFFSFFLFLLFSFAYFPVSNVSQELVLLVSGNISLRQLCQSSIHILIPVVFSQYHVHHLAVPGQLAHVFLQDVNIVRPL